MNWLAEILVLLLSLSGLLFGLALAYIAPEELKAGKKYFLWLKRILFIVIAVVIADQLASPFPKKIILWIILIIFLLASVILFILNLIKKKHFQETFSREIFNYILFFIPYFFMGSTEGKLLIASLIFLYGLPAGTLLKR